MLLIIFLFGFVLLYYLFIHLFIYSFIYLFTLCGLFSLFRWFSCYRLGCFGCHSVNIWSCSDIQTYIVVHGKVLR